MRIAMTSAVLFSLAACGSERDVALVYPSVAQASALENGDTADAILGQLSDRGSTATRTDSGGFGSVVGVAVGLANEQLWVADGTNKRLLGFSNAAALTDGAAASTVLNQQDFTTNDFRNIPVAQKVTPAGVAVDHEGRVYVHGLNDDSGLEVVLVYEDPFSDDKLADFALDAVPANIQSIRSLDNNKLAVVGVNAIAFYERGLPSPYAQAGFAPLCVSSAYDIAEDGGIYFIACSGGLTCSSGVGLCAGVVAYEINSVTGFVDRDDITGLPTPYVAYIDLVGARSLQINSNRLLVADTDGHRILRFDNPATQALSVIGGSLAQTPTNAITTYGQPDGITVPVPNYHNSGTPQISEQGLYSPTDLAISPVDRRMWVADFNNNRVVAYTDIAGTNPDRNAQIVLGQPDKTHAFTNRVEPDAFGLISGISIGPGPGGLPRAAIADAGTHRVLLYDDISGFAAGTDPDEVLGQAFAIDYRANRATTTPPIANGFDTPTHVAIGPNNGWVWVTDSVNRRVLAFENAATGQSANRVFGAINLTTVGVYNDFGAIAVSSDHLFVAAGNRVFMYPITSPGRKPTRVFGQEQPPAGDPVGDDIGNGINRGGGAGAPRADSLYDVVGVAIDSDGRLWVADRGNNRVLWFDEPSSTTADLTDIVAADGVVGQPDFSSGEQRMGTGEVNRYSFGGISDIAITDDGTLWVSDSVDSRVLAFFTPRQIDPTLGVPRADLVLGQDQFDASGANNAPNGINARTLSGPYSVAADATGRVLLVSDRGNHRALRFIDNEPPEVSGDGTYEVVRGESLVVTVTVTDPENDSIDISPVDPYVGSVSGAPPLSVPVTFMAPDDAPVGGETVVNVVATDRGPRPQRTTFSVVFRVVDRATDPTTGTPPAPRPPIDPDTGCACGGASAPWLVGLLLLRRRRRRG